MRTFDGPSSIQRTQRSLLNRPFSHVPWSGLPCPGHTAGLARSVAIDPFSKYPGNLDMCDP
jgi:hypothetical protein